MALCDPHAAIVNTFCVQVMSDQQISAHTSKVVCSVIDHSVFGHICTCEFHDAGIVNLHEGFFTKQNFTPK